MRKLVLVLGCAVGLAFVAKASRSDDLGSTKESPPSVDLSSPATVPLGANPPRDPFTPFDIGPPEAAWSYEQLSPADQAVADRGRQPVGTQAEIDAYNAVLQQQAADANARMAGRLLGVDSLGDVGVVP